MTSGKGTPNGGAVTPTEDKGTRKNSTEANPSKSATGESSKAANGGHNSNNARVPNWNGPQQDSSASDGGDPFTKGAKDADEGVKLSVQATSFRPNGHRPAPISFLNRNSEADEGPVVVSSSILPSGPKKDKGKGRAVQEPIGTRGENVSPGRVYYTTDVGPNVVCPGGHYIKIEHVSVKELSQSLEALYGKFDWQSKLRGCSAPPPADGKYHMFILLNFDDIRDADTAFADIELVSPSWTARYVSQTEYASGRKEGGSIGVQEATSFHDGQVVFIAKYGGLSRDFTVDGLYDHVMTIASSFGEIFSVSEIEIDAINRQYRMEYYKTSAAKSIVETFSQPYPVYFKDWTLNAEELPDFTLQAAQTAKGMIGTPQKVSDGNKALVASPTGRTAWYINENGDQEPTRGFRQVPKCGPVAVGTSLTPHPSHLRQSDSQFVTPDQHPGAFIRARSGFGDTPVQYHHGTMTAPAAARRYNQREDYHDLDASGLPNTLDREKIVNGSDVRTTVMLRNLPNGITSDILKQILDLTSKGKYDFSYLRIDFSRSRNVGYAFVNFTNPIHIIEFYDNYNGNMWVNEIRGTRYRGYLRPRRAEISYATVQGVDCAIEKFRNSSVMDEYQGYRPKLWYTADDAPHPWMIGMEKPFPGVNNESKHQRSRNNATQIGLYAPQSRRINNGGQQRRSQYDRGTTAQVQEDMYYNQVPQMHAGYGYGQNYAFNNGPMPVPPPTQYPPMMPNVSGYDAYGNAIYNGAPMINGNGYGYGYGYVPFTDPFNNGHHVRPSVPPSRLRTISNGRLGGGQPNIILETRQHRSLSQAIRDNEQNYAEQAAYDAAQAARVAGEMSQHTSPGSQGYAYQNGAYTNAEGPRVFHGEENAQGNANTSAYHTNGQGSTNGHIMYQQH